MTAALAKAKDPAAGAKAAITAILAGEDDELGADWQLVDGRGRRDHDASRSATERHTRRTGRLRDRSGGKVWDRAVASDGVGLLGRLQQRATAAGADERLGRLCP